MSLLLLPILMYHQVATTRKPGHWAGNYVLAGQFERQIRALHEWGYTTVTLDDWLRYRQGATEAPERPIAITFDDGYRSIFQIAWPLLSYYEAVATVFLVSDVIGKTNLWDSPGEREPLLSGAEIQKMARSGVPFGSHTQTHRSLVDMTVEDARNELRGSKRKLEELIGKPVTLLAYPYNKQNGTVRALAKSAGYRAAVVGRGRVNASWTNPFLLMRIRVDAQTTFDDFARQLKKLRWWQVWRNQ